MTIPISLLSFDSAGPYKRAKNRKRKKNILHNSDNLNSDEFRLRSEKIIEFISNN